MAITDVFGANLVSHWTFDDVLTDSHTSGNDLTHSGTPAYVTGALNNGLTLEQSSSERVYITDASQTGLDFSTAFSAHFWINFESLSSNQILFSKWQSSINGRSYTMRWQTDNTLVLTTSATGVAGSAVNKSVSWTPSTATKYAIGVSYDAGTIKFYVNGSQQGTTQTGGAASLYNGGAPFEIGSQENGDTYLDATYVDEFSIGNVVLSDADFATLYNSGTPLEYGGATTRRIFNIS